MINIENITLLDLLPSSLKKDPTIMAISKSLDKYMKANIELRKRLNFMHRIDEIEDGGFLDALAYQFHVDFYDHTLSLDKKKELVKTSISHHRKKGTKWATEDLLSKAFDTSYIKEWFEYDGEPYFFKIYTKDNLVSEEKYKDTIKALNTVKNTRSWLEKIIVERDLRHNLYLGITNRQLKTNSYYPNSLKDIKVNNPINIGITSRQVKSSNYTINVIEDIKVINPIFFAGKARIFKEIKMEVEHVKL